MYKNGLLNYDFFDETDSDIIENDDDDVYINERRMKKSKESSVLVVEERDKDFDNGIVEKTINDDNIDNSTKVYIGKTEEVSDSDVKTDVRKVKAKTQKKEKNEKSSQKDNSANTVIKKSIVSLTSSDSSSDEIIDEESAIEKERNTHNVKSDKKICNIIPLKCTIPRTIFS